MAKRPTPRNLFSFSRLKAFDQCPARYRYRYLKGLREAFQSVEAHLGTVVHDVLEWLYREREGAADPTPDAALERFDAIWQERWDEAVAVIRIDDRPDDSRLVGHEMLRRFFDAVFRDDRSRTLALEQRFSLRISENIHFTGFADRVGRTERGRLFVVDYKTSKSLGDSSDFSEGLQAPLYAACALAGDGGDTEALAGYHYLRHGETHWHPVDRDRSQHLIDRFRVLADTARSATDFPTRPGPLCAWCGFNHLCPDARVPDHLAGGLILARQRAADDAALSRPRLPKV